MSRRPTCAARRIRRRNPRLLLLVIVVVALVCAAGYLSTGLAGTAPAGTDSAGTAPGGSAPAGTAGGAVAPTIPGSVPGSVPASVPGSGLSSSEALALLAALPNAVYTDNGSYAGNREELFGDAWELDFDQNGCDTRNDILARDLADTDIDPGNCRVYSGILTDPYTGQRVDFERGQNTSAEVQIDHLLPLKAVYATGGEAWPAGKREALANDPVNLLAVKGSENASKSDSLPSDWLPGFYPDVSDRHDLGQRVAWDDLPQNTSLQCWYIDKLLPVFVAYGLGVTPEDRAAMTAVLTTCPA